MTKVYAPLVSIIIPVYNGSDYLKEAIDSALNQTYKNCEVLVINDGSNDGGKTEEIAKLYGNKIKYYTKENGGVSSALNLGVKEMKGDYFSWLSHDDIYHCQKIEKQISLIDQCDEETLIICETGMIDCDSNTIKSTKKKCRLKVNQLNSWADALNELFKNMSYYGCAFLIPKSAFEKVGYFREDLRYIQDVAMWIQFFTNKMPVMYSRDVLVWLRIHEKQLTQTGRKLFHEESIALAKSVIPKLLCLDEVGNKFLYEYAMYNARYGNASVVETCIRKGKRLFTVSELFNIMAISLYGQFRPLIRKFYYRFVRKIKTS